MDLFESIADRRIKAARAAGLFDNLPGAGRPIPDLDRERPPGWWAMRIARREQSMLKAEELDDLIRKTMPRLWRLDSETDVRTQVGELNESIDAYNRITTWEPRSPLDEVQVVEEWTRLRRWRSNRSG